MPRSIALLHNSSDMARALSLLVSGYRPAEQAGYLDTLAKLVGRPAAADELAVVEEMDETRRTGVALAQLLAGKAALVWPVRAIDEALARELLARLLNELRSRGVLVAQSLTSPDEQ